MSDPHSKTAESDMPPGCAPAFEALKKYDRGSPRSSLIPIDNAVLAAISNPKARPALENRLLEALQETTSAPSREYVCSKLALIGTAAAVPGLIPLLRQGELATAARTALESIPGDAPSRALRKALTGAEGPVAIGLINSLGARRDPAAVGVLNSLANNPDSRLAAAACAALGRIGTVRAARALQTRASQHAGVTPAWLADALLTCASQLKADGRKSECETLLKPLNTPAQPRYVRDAARKL